MAKQKQTQQEAYSEELQERIKGAINEITPIFQKYQVGVGAKLEFKESGIAPVPAWVDTKPKPTE